MTHNVGGPIPAVPPLEVTVDVRPAVRVANSKRGGLTVKQLHRLQRIVPPLPDELSLPEEQGRFQPQPLVGDAYGALDPRTADTFQYSAVTPPALRGALSTAVGTEGFTVVPAPRAPTTRKLPKEVGFEISGTVLAERNLRVDRNETRRMDRARYAGVLGGALGAVVLGDLSLTHLSSSLGLLILPAGLAVAVLLISAASFDNAAYWSDLVLARYEGRVPPPPKGTAPPAVPTEYEVQLWVVRALSHDWGIRGASGRTLVAGGHAGGLEPTRSALRRAVTGRDEDVSEPVTPSPEAGVATMGWTAHTSLGQ
jgi:hypothetical protein